MEFLSAVGIRGSRSQGSRCRLPFTTQNSPIPQANISGAGPKCYVVSLWFGNLKLETLAPKSEIYEKSPTTWINAGSKAAAQVGFPTAT